MNDGESNWFKPFLTRRKQKNIMDWFGFGGFKFLTKAVTKLTLICSPKDKSLDIEPFTRIALGYWSASGG